MKQASDIKLPRNYLDLTHQARKVVREEYVRRQDGKCSHCATPLSDKAADHVMKLPINQKLFPPSFFKWPVHLHHCHTTGMTIGAVHCHCNAVLWQYHGE